MNKNSKLVSVILSIVALVLFAVSFLLTIILDKEKNAVANGENPIMIVGVVISALGLIMCLINNHKMLKLVPVITFVLFALYVSSNFAGNIQDIYNMPKNNFLNYPVLNFLAVILFAVSAVFMVKDGYKWARVVFVITSLFLATIVIFDTMSLYYLFDTEGAAHVSLYFVGVAVLALTPAVAALVGYLPETEAKEEVKAEEAKEEVAEENVETTEEVAEDTKDEEVKEEAPAQENNDAEESSNDEVKLDFGDNN